MAHLSRPDALIFRYHVWREPFNRQNANAHPPVFILLKILCLSAENVTNESHKTWFLPPKSLSCQTSQIQYFSQVLHFRGYQVDIMFELSSATQDCVTCDWGLLEIYFKTDLIMVMSAAYLENHVCKWHKNDALLVKHSALDVVCSLYILMAPCVGTNIKSWTLPSLKVTFVCFPFQITCKNMSKMIHFGHVAEQTCRTSFGLLSSLILPMTNALL